MLNKVNDPCLNIYASDIKGLKKKTREELMDKIMAKTMRPNLGIKLITTYTYTYYILIHGWFGKYILLFHYD